MAQESLITDEVRAAIGVEVVGTPELIEMGAIRQYARAITWPDPPDPLYVDEEYACRTPYGGIVAPWTFHTSLGRSAPRPSLPLPPPRVVMNGGNDYEYLQPIRPGDFITTRRKIVEATEREGRGGKLVFVVTESTFTNQRGEVVGISRGTIINQY